MQIYVLQLYSSCSSMCVTRQRKRYQNYRKAAGCSEQGRWAGLLFHLIHNCLSPGLPGETSRSDPHPSRRARGNSYLGSGAEMQKKN